MAEKLIYDVKMETINKVDNTIKKNRNFLLTLFIYFDIILCAIGGFTYLVYIIKNNPLFVNYPEQCIVSIALSLLNIFYLTKILKWEKDGFWGIVVVSVMSLIMNLSMPEFGESYRFNVLITPVILYLIMQIKKNGVSSWNHIYREETIKTID